MQKKKNSVLSFLKKQATYFCQWPLNTSLATFFLPWSHKSSSLANLLFRTLYILLLELAFALYICVATEAGVVLALKVKAAKTTTGHSRSSSNWQKLFFQVGVGEKEGVSRAINSAFLTELPIKNVKICVLKTEPLFLKATQCLKIKKPSHFSNQKKSIIFFCILHFFNVFECSHQRFPVFSSLVNHETF